jgi:Ni/Co efflux regulator RcnB
MQKVLRVALLAGLCAGFSTLSFAENAWMGYGSSDRSKTYGRSPSRPHYAPQSHYPQRPYPQRRHWHYPPAQSQSGLNIQYQGPTTIYQNSTSYSWVSGDPDETSIESSRYTVITDWQRLGLPAPPRGSYWSYENGHYLLLPNR